MGTRLSPRAYVASTCSSPTNGAVRSRSLSAHRPRIAHVSDWITKRLLQYRTRGELLVDTFAVVGFFAIMVLFVRLVDW